MSEVKNRVQIEAIYFAPSIVTLLGMPAACCCVARRHPTETGLDRSATDGDSYTSSILSTTA
jgi:hypothetical protein